VPHIDNCSAWCVKCSKEQGFCRLCLSALIPYVPLALGWSGLERTALQQVPGHQQLCCQACGLAMIPPVMVQVAFLDYIRRWKKKVVFVLNKADVLKEQADLDAVTGFVRDNAQRLLQLDSPVVLPVSARKALRAKLAVSRYAPPVMDCSARVLLCSR
jgi:hypothetical protein